MVMGIVAILGSLALVLGADAYRGSSFRNEKTIIVSVLQRARSQATSNICMGGGCTAGKAHGVRLEVDKYTVFQGLNYAGRDSGVDQVINSSFGITFAPTSILEVVFSQLSGDASPSGDIVLQDSFGHIATISVNAEGQIDW